ncbi:MAG: DUF262 domain-containing protein [Roseibium sp.]|uniref:GmrSD restriction endonuclease domain-containing protein n=1 Tax=Roseibium sp. TaxID=1936156 RepID=UPI0032983039
MSLNTLISRLREGRYVIPDFQREFEWKPWDIRDLMRSIFLDYYVGSLLLWKGKKENFDALSCEPIYGFDGGGNAEYIVLDGQQRLTALYYAFLAPDVPLPNRANRAVYYLNVEKFMNEEYDQAFHYDWLSRRFEKLLSNREAQYESHLFPLSVVGAGGWEMPNWVQGYEKFWTEVAREAETQNDQEAADHARLHTQNAKAFGEHLRGIVEQYQISFIELDRDLAIDKVCDIFTQINSRGVRLDIFDLVNALLKPKGLQLKHMWREASERLAFPDSEKMNVYILQVMSILRQAYCSPKYLYFLLPGQEKPVRDPDGTRRKEVLVPDIADFEKRWTAAVTALEAAIKMIQHPQEFGATSSRYLPYVTILPVFAALQAQVKASPPEIQLDAQRKIRHWYWASVFMNRYSGSVESTSSRDFLDVRDWIADDATEPSLILEFKTRFRALDLRKEIKRGTSVYNGIFNLFVIEGARDWITGNIPQHDDLDDHHIVPASWGGKNLPGNTVHTILNRSPLIGDTNRKVISDKLPNAYLPDLIAKNGEKTVRVILESHFISPRAFDILLRDPFSPEDFEDFIVERQRTLFDAIESLLIKERLDLSPQLRELDADIESTELALRKMVTEGLDQDAGLLPQHVKDKIEDRIQRAAKKNPAFDADRYTMLDGKLEYCDLRELQDVISAKATWDRFQGRFVNKETLFARFGQLAELRNGIRHSRTVDEITKKEGEAALLWFRKVVFE